MKKEKKPMEFSKKLVAWALIITTLSILTSYVLSIIGCDPCQEITIAVITTCVAVAVGYEAKSFGEKNSRNKYGVDEDGIPNEFLFGLSDKDDLDEERGN